MSKNAITVFNSSPEEYETYQRKAKMMVQASMFTGSGILSKGDDHQKLANAMIVMDTAQSMGISPLVVNQEMYEIHGKPSFSSKFMIAAMESTGKFSTLRYDIEGDPSDTNFRCRAWAIELATKEKLVGPWVSMDMAKKEGWLAKKGSKWQTMPELMIRYRSAVFFIRSYCPSISLGFMPREEIEDVHGEMLDVTPDDEGNAKKTENPKKTRIKASSPAPSVSIPKDEEATPPSEKEDVVIDQVVENTPPQDKKPSEPQGEVEDVEPESEDDLF